MSSFTKASDLVDNGIKQAIDEQNKQKAEQIKKKAELEVSKKNFNDNLIHTMIHDLQKTITKNPTETSKWYNDDLLDKGTLKDELAISKKFLDEHDVGSVLYNPYVSKITYHRDRSVHLKNRIELLDIEYVKKTLDELGFQLTEYIVVKNIIFCIPYRKKIIHRLTIK